MPKFSGMTREEANNYRAGHADSYGNPPEIRESNGSAPCRCCLKLIDESKQMLVLAYRPFANLHAYAETGPIFLCADECANDSAGVPEVVVSPEYLLKAYSHDERIIYGTGRITPKDEVSSYSDELLLRKDVAFVDMRSARNNCWQARMTRS